MSFKKSFLGFMCLATICSVASAETWYFTASTGSPFSLPTPLVIEQNGQPKLDFTANYEAKPFKNFTYWAVKLGAWDQPMQNAWEFEVIHHKIYLTNNPPEVQIFNISDGFNMFMINRVIRADENIFRLGAGPVITHQEAVVRNLAWRGHTGILSSSFYLGGAAVQASVERRFYVNSNTYLNVECKFSAAYVDVPIEQGRAQVPNLAFHLLFGIGNETKDFMAEDVIGKMKFLSALTTPFVLSVLDDEQRPLY